MKSWMPATLSLLTLALWAGPVSAVEMKPNNATEPALIRGGPAGGAWYAVPDGGALTFDVMGPATLEVELIQRLPSDKTGPKAQVKAKGDGMDILTVKIDGSVGQGSIMDGSGGTPSVVGKAKINVPAGQHVFSLEPASGSLPMLARVDAPTSALVGVRTVVASTAEDVQPVISEPMPQPTAEPVAAEPMPEPAVLDAAAEPVAAEPVMADPEPAAEDPEPVDDSYWDDDAFGGPSFAEDDESTIAAASEPSTELPAPAATTTGQEPKLWVGARTGLGAAQTGNQASMYLGLELLYKIGVPNVHVGARLGRYGIGLKQELAIQPPIGGTATAQTLDWSTRVRPLEFGARYTLPLGGVHAYGWGALAAYSATRVDEDDRTRGASLGTTWAMGLDFDVGPGVLSPELAFNLGSQDFGNLDLQGEAARERLSSSRLNLAYRIAF
ncbi:MAG: hypothetical protein ACI9VR_000626 [Cognaticolwellia sp.]